MSPEGTTKSYILPSINYAAYSIAQKYFPATAKGSQAQATGSVAMGWGGVKEINVVTSANGKLMIFESGGLGLSTPQASISATTGPIFGDGFDSPKDFTGGSVQWGGSVGNVGSVAGDYWFSLGNPYPDTEGNTVPNGQVWGYDAGISLGLPVPLPGSGQVSIVNAEPIEEEIQLDGVGLLTCRILYQCGRDPSLR